MTKDDDLALVFRQLVKHILDPAVALPFDHLCFSTVFSEIQDLENILVFAVPDGGCALYFSEMIHAQVVRNAHSPRKEFSFIRVSTTANGIYNSDKNILENVFGKVLVLNKKVNGRIQFVLVTQYKDFKGVYIAGVKRVDQLVIGQSG